MARSANLFDMSDSVSPPIERNPVDGTYHVSRKWTASQSTTVAIVTVIDAIPSLEFAETETVHDRVDPDALDSLFEPTAAGPRPAGSCVRIAFRNFTVVVHSDGELVVRPASLETPEQ